MGKQHYNMIATSSISSPINHYSTDSIVPRKILIIGGGFAGIKAVLDLAKLNFKSTTITLISDKLHFEYHASLYKVVTGRSPLEVCIPIPEIVHDKGIDFIKDKIIDVNLVNKKVTGENGSSYYFDILILGLGSETTYFGIEGLKEHSFGIKSIHEALALKKHLHKTFESCMSLSAEEKTCATEIVVIGGGPTGTELAAELSIYAKKLAKKNNIAPEDVSVTLIERADRILPTLPANISKLAHTRLEDLGVNVLLNKEVLKEDIQKVYLKDMELNTKTVVWTAGVKANSLYEKITGLVLTKNHKVEVDNYLRVPTFNSVYVVGDGAATRYSGMATTAVADGAFVASHIREVTMGIKGQTRYNPVPPEYIIPVGAGWAIAMLKGKLHTGKVGWLIRRRFDFSVFRIFLPFKKAITAFREGARMTQTCESCEPDVVSSLF